MIKENEVALKLIVQSIKAGYINGKDVSICLDVAANELYKKVNTQYSHNNFLTLTKLFWVIEI